MAEGGARPIGAAEVAGVADALADAFSDDPVFRWTARFDGDMTSRLRPMFTAMAKQRMKLDDPLLHGVPVGGDDEPGAAEVAAAALWYEPGRELSWDDAVASIPSALSCFRWGIVRGMRLNYLLENAHPSEPHYHLFAVGVRRESQGRGLGSEVLRPMLERCDDEGIAAYLENSKPRNEAFYARHGFEPLEPLPLPEGAPPLTPMLRWPR